MNLIKMLALTVLLVFGSCKTREKLVYFQNPINSSIVTDYSIHVKNDDFLSIVISGEDIETVSPFNMPSEQDSRAANNGYTSGVPVKSGYLVDKEGKVKLPVIGDVILAGLTRDEATKLIEEKLEEYLKNPIVTIHIQNFKVTVLGEVEDPGTFTIPNERISILEAIGLAGDLKVTGKRNNVLIVRDTDGVKEEIRIDLTDSKLFESPAYYLVQNDVVYVEPNRAARSNSTFVKNSASILISTAALVITTISVIIK